MKDNLEKDSCKVEDMYEISKEFNKVAREYDQLAADYNDPSIEEKVEASRPSEEEREKRAAKREKIIELKVSYSVIVWFFQKKKVQSILILWA